ncbi:thioredoxin domain [Acinetobacter phage Acj9]|uniref:Glutaredoxin domain-containing protein n=1 Tax=Acinetobacter phage Acj9 TaxID=760939 RepID=E5EQ09_9CAUD|nr:thioredoxin domain [Acinetobacter phage Acj9]ADG60125.1 conserved hypothetical protein [Acinetobacter phage Acj9]
MEPIMITLYSKDNCPQCTQAKQFLTVKGIRFEVKMLDEDYTLDELKASAPGRSSFPVVFVNGVAVGAGYPDVRKVALAK